MKKVSNNECADAFPTTAKNSGWQGTNFVTPHNWQKYDQAGFKAYRVRRYTEACLNYNQAREMNPDYTNSDLADIYLRNLCNHNHSKREAACLYLENKNDSDVYSYLMTIDKKLFDVPVEEAIEILVKYWENK